MIIVILAALSASLALADDFKTTDGKEYKEATVTRVDPDGIMVKTKSVMVKLYFTELPKEVQQRFNYDPQRATAYSAEQTAAIQKSSEQGAKEQAGIQWMQQTAARCRVIAISITNASTRKIQYDGTNPYSIETPGVCGNRPGPKRAPYSFSKLCKSRFTYP
jgi:hypothetical protein